MSWFVVPFSCRDADLPRRRLDVKNPPRKTPTPAEVAGKELLAPEELAVVLGCGRTTAYRLIAERKISSLKIGRLRRVRRSDVDSYVERLIRAAEQEGPSA
jgi:excisionase family DNA binding protein